MPKGHPGQITKLTDHIRKEFERLLPTTLYIETVADMIGISRITLRNWMMWGREESDFLDDDPLYKVPKDRMIYLKFFYSYKRGLAEAEANQLHLIREAAERGQYQAAQWLLERRRPDRWGSQAKEIKEIKQMLIELQKKQEQMALSSPPPSPPTTT